MQKVRGYIIGIDPDIDRSGVAMLDVEAGRFLHLQAMPFSDMVRYLDSLAAGPYSPLRVVIEDSWTTTHNWHLYGMSLAKAAAIGRSTGLCHATGMLTEQMARSAGLDVHLLMPLKKTWRGRDGKITQEEISQFVPDWPARTNQEVRDAALLAWCHAGLPIRLKSWK